MTEPKFDCPFCGSKGIVLTQKGFSSLTGGYKEMHKVECAERKTTCPVNMRTHYCDTPEEAVALWDTRHQPNPYGTVLEESLQGEET